MNIERREFVRHQIRPHTIFLYSNYSPVKGWVKDISKGGMAFEYTPMEGCAPKPEMRLILAGDAFPFYLPDILCKTIYDIKVDKNDQPFKVIGNRRCGAQYEKLDPEMKEKLADMLTIEVIMKNSELKPEVS
jgi:c-di-GMP-binding flagellar brake protein YcgR